MPPDWIGYESEKGLGIRAGRFMPAYGINFADHTSFTRADLGLDKYDQVYGVELSYTAQYETHNQDLQRHSDGDNNGFEEGKV